MSQKQLGSFHLKAKSVETLKQLVSVINVLADEVPLELNENGITRKSHGSFPSCHD